MRIPRRLSAAIAAVVLCAGLAVAGVSMSASASVGPFAFTSAANATLGIQLSGSALVDGSSPDSITIGGNGTGYQELTDNGLCLTYVSTTNLTGATCTGSAAQLWQSATHSGTVLWWNKANPGSCKFDNGTTQLVISVASQGPALSLACPPTTGPAWPYTTSQEWVEQPPIGPSPSGSPSVSPSPSPSPTPPPPSCATPPAIEPAPDVPAYDQTGALITSLTGAQLVQQYDASQTMFDGSHTNADPPTVDANGDAVLTTNGNTNDQAMLSSCFFNGTGSVYTHGIFEAVINVPAASGGEPGNIANWPAFWLSGYNCNGSTPQPAGSSTTLGCWPNGGEFDVYESGPFSGGYQRVDYHYGANASGDQASSNDTALKAGWHTVDAVWGPGYVAVYIDGSQEFSYTSSNVESGFPLQVIFDNAGGGQGIPSTVLIRSLKVWEFV